MQIVNPLSAYPIGAQAENINSVNMRGNFEKQGVAFSRAGYLAAREDPTIDPDKLGAALRRQLRPLSKTTLERARGEYARREVRPFPRYFIIEPNASCNKRCVFCPILVTNRRGNLPWEHFIKLMRECREYDVFGISLYQLSEPLLYRGRDEAGRPKDIADMVNAARSIGGFKAVNISTNADVSNLNRLLDCDVDDVFISIDGLTEEVYLQSRPSAKPNDVGAFARTVERAESFLAEKTRRGLGRPWVRMQIINAPQCAHQVLDFVRRWIDVPGVDDILVKNLDGMNAWLGDSVVSAADSAAKRAAVETMPCQHLWAIGSMTATGALNACCHDSLTELTTAGANIAEMSFADWWNGEYMTALRAEHSGGVFRLPCKNCLERDPWLG